jgi:response regulator RpfG family c-di-GMP phosphodiesterase
MTDTDSKPLKVLLVDDEPNILMAYQRLLRMELFETVYTTSPDEAFELLKFNQFAVVVSDQRMPQMLGSLFLEKAREISPKTVRIMLTGYSDMQAAMDAINRGSVYRYLTKPWRDDEFKLTIRQALTQYRMGEERTKAHELIKKQNSELQELSKHLERKVFERTQEISALLLQLEQSLLGTVQVLAGIMDIHDESVGSHCRRVAALSRELGIELGVTGRDLLELQIAAKLHDLGKVGIPLDILRKPETERTPEELEQVAAHVIRGAATLRGVPNIGHVPVYVRHHHENLDGTGFPDRLTEKQIPLNSKIIAVANAFDHELNIQTIYQNTTSLKALGEVKKASGTRFDPKVVKALSKCIYERIKDKGEEIELCMKNLKAGMTISREIRTAQGILLFPKDTFIDERHLEQLRSFLELDPFADIVYVYKVRAAARAS